ncbi:MAG: LysM peptidoglycan-binding domain-containing protein [Anaerolineae bacterium]
MMHRRFLSVLVTLLVLLPLLAFPVSVLGQEPTIYTHTVRTGQTLTGIASLYNITLTTLKETNKLTSNVIYPGQKLQIPLAATMVVHVVVRGENLIGIGAKYNARVRDIAWANAISNTNLIYPGQKLVIPPVKGVLPSTPAPTPETTLAYPVVQEAIIITGPILNAKVTSPVTVTGWGSGFENTLSVAILDEDGRILGQGTVMVNAEFGQYGPFTGTLTFKMPATAQVAKLQVYSVSARDGSIDHLNSVLIKLEP